MPVLDVEIGADGFLEKITAIAIEDAAPRLRAEKQIPPTAHAASE
jgi:hypothetical protein